MLVQFRNPARCARLLAIKATELQYEQDHGHRRVLSGQSLQLARTAGDPRALAEALKGACFALRAPDTLQQRIGIVAEFVELARSLDDPALEYWASLHSTCVHLEAADMPAAAASLQQLKRSEDRLAQPSFTSTARTLVGNWSLLYGDLATAEQLADQALQAGDAAGEGDARMRHAMLLTQIRVHQGRGAEMVNLVQQRLDGYPEMSVWHVALADISCWLG